MFFFCFDSGDELNGRKIQEAIGFDKLVGQLEPLDLEGMRRSIIIIEISIGINESSFLHYQLNSLYQFSNTTEIATQLYLDIKLFSRLHSKIFSEKS